MQSTLTYAVDTAKTKKILGMGEIQILRKIPRMNRRDHTVIQETQGLCT